MDAHTATCLTSGSAHASKLLSGNAETEKSSNDFLAQTLHTLHFRCIILTIIAIVNDKGGLTMRAEFTNNLVTGNKTIDSQHKELIAKINDLLSALETSQSQSTAMRMLNFLNDYVEYHFEAEENLQKEVGYPGLADHQAQHAALKQTVADLTEMLNEEEGATPAFVEQLNKKVIEWLYKHIEGYDRSVAEYIYLAENPDRY